MNKYPEIIPYGKQFIDQTDIDQVIATLKSPFLTQGPRIEEFEQKFSGCIQSKYAVAVNNGTSALHLAYLAIDVSPGDKVLTPGISFAATANAILYCKAIPVFCDIRTKGRFTGTMDLNQAEDLIKKHQIRKISIVSLAGRPVDYDGLKYLKNKYDLKIVEDACHALGASSVLSDKNQSVKTGGTEIIDASTFSFHPVKHVALGEGGMISTQDNLVSNRLRLLRTHGIHQNAELFTNMDRFENQGAWYSEMSELGFNYRLPDILAALGISQLDKLEHSIRERNRIARYYDLHLEKLPLEQTSVLNQETEGTHAYHLYIVYCQDSLTRLKLYNFLREHNIYCQIHYRPTYSHPYYKRNNFDLKLTNCEWHYERCLSLPMYPTLTTDQLEYVVHTIKMFYSK